MNWDCTVTEERLSDFLDGTLSPEETEAFAAHNAGCGVCTLMVAEVSDLVGQMQRTPFIEEPPLLMSKILVATLGPRKQERASAGLFGWLSAIWQPRFAMGMATVAASFVIVFHGSSVKSNKDLMTPGGILRAANREVHLTYAHGAKFVNDLRLVYEIQSRLASQPDSTPPASGQPSSSEPRRQDEQETSRFARAESSQGVARPSLRQTAGEFEFVPVSIATRGSGRPFFSSLTRSFL